MTSEVSCLKRSCVLLLNYFTNKFVLIMMTDLTCSLHVELNFKKCACSNCACFRVWCKSFFCHLQSSQFKTIRSCGLFYSSPLSSFSFLLSFKSHFEPRGTKNCDLAHENVPYSIYSNGTAFLERIIARAFQWLTIFFERIAQAISTASHLVQTAIHFKTAYRKKHFA